MFHMQLECPDRPATLRNAIILALGGLLLAACAAPIQRANVTSVTVQPRDEGYVAVVQGEHPDACMQLGLTSQTVKDGKIEVGLLQAAPDPNAVCAQVITPFNEEVPLDVSGLTMGTYTVTVNGVAAELTLGAQPAALPATSPAASPAPPVQPAPVAAVETATRDGSLVLTVSGELPDPCHEIAAVTQSVAGDVITVNISVNPPAPDMICAQVMTPYSIEIPLDTPLAPGAYTLHVNDYTAAVTVE